MNDLKVGDKVILVKDFDRAKKGWTGKIILIKFSDIGIEFDEECVGDWCEHDLDGRIDNERGYFVKGEYLELIVKKCVEIPFEAGTNISSYVKKLLKKETDKDRIKWLKTFDNCVLPDKVKNMIDESITLVLRSDMFEKWGINEHFEKV